MKFNGTRLRALIELMAYKNIDIARKVGVTGKTVGRWTRGEATPPASTIEKIAKELGVSAKVLTGQAPMEKPKHVNLQPRSKLVENITVRTQNALLVAAKRYQVSQTQIIELAPLMFTLIAEGSLDFRRREVEKAGSNMDALDESPMGFPTLCILDALCAEQDSIESRDIFGAEIEEWAIGNPFDKYLCCLVKGLRDVKAIHLSESDGIINRSNVGYVSEFSVFHEEYMKIADNDEKIAKRLTNGSIDLGSLPEELSAVDSRKERIQWFNQEAQRAKEQEVELGRKFLEQLCSCNV